MSQSAGKITAPVSIQDIRKALGEKAKTARKLCTSELINIWSVKKPIRYPSKKKLPMSVFLENKCGVVVHTYPTYQDMSRKASGQDGGLVQYSYDRPTGGEESPYRLSDFDGYDHYAACPFAVEVESAMVDGYLHATTSIDTDIMAAWGYGLQDFAFGLWIVGVGVYMNSTINGIAAIEGRELRFNAPLPSDYGSGDVRFVAGQAYEARVVMTDFWATEQEECGNRWYASPGTEQKQAQWIVLPADRYPTFSPIQAPTIFSEITLQASGSGVYSQLGGAPTISGIILSVELQAGADAQGTWIAEVSFAIQGQEVARWSNVSVTAGCDLSRTLEHADALELAASLKDEGECPVSVSMSMRREGQDGTYTQTDTIYITLTEES